MSRRPYPSSDPEYGLPDLIWPTELLLPHRPPRLLYLDLNHWIELARAQQGSGQKSYEDLLDALRASIQAGGVQVVLSGSLFREVSKVTSQAQRKALKDLVAELSDFTYLAGLPDIFRLELQAMLNQTTRTSGLRLGPVPLLGRGILHAMGRVGGLRVYQDDHDITDELLRSDPTWQERLAQMERQAEEEIFEGPDATQAAEMRGSGYRPEIPQQRVRDNAAFEQDWSARIAPFRSTRHLRDLVIARHLSLELIDMITEELLARGLTMEQVIVSPEVSRGRMMSMPSTATMVSLLTQYHQDPNKSWKQNDMYDIDALATAVPYCDIVFTDAAARDAVIRRQLQIAMDTVLPRRPGELIDELI